MRLPIYALLASATQPVRMRRWDQGMGIYVVTELQTTLRRNDVATMKQQLATLVHGYQPAEGISDWVHLERNRRRSFR